MVTSIRYQFDEYGNSPALKTGDQLLYVEPIRSQPSYKKFDRLTTQSTGYNILIKDRRLIQQ